MTKEINEIKTDDIATRLLTLDENVFRKLKRIKMMCEKNERSTEWINIIITAYYNIDCVSPYNGLDNVISMLNSSDMTNDIPMISEEIISISNDIEKLKAIIRAINKLCGSHHRIFLLIPDNLILNTICICSNICGPINIKFCFFKR